VSAWAGGIQKELDKRKETETIMLERLTRIETKVDLLLTDKPHGR
jgi:hypothetical protein